MIDINNMNQLKCIDSRLYDKILKVHLDKRDLEYIPEIIFKFTNLQVLNLSSNLIKIIPNNIGDLVNLQELYLDRNHISEIPEEIGKLCKLRKVILSNNKIKYLPNSFYNLENLEILNISCNHLGLLSDDISKLEKLEYLYLRNNRLRYIPKDIAKIKVTKIFYDSYENLNNLSYECEYLQIENLDKPLTNLPINIQELRLYLPKLKLTEIKLPFGCKLYEDDILRNL
jgi:leucine-rich repeat protein SHOC2